MQNTQKVKEREIGPLYYKDSKLGLHTASLKIEMHLFSLLYLEIELHEQIQKTKNGGEPLKQEEYSLIYNHS